MRTALACLNHTCSLEQECCLERECCLHQLAAEIRNYHRSHLRELRFEVLLSGVVIRGVSRSYYGKQLALHEIRRRCRLLVTANRIEVEEVEPNTVSRSDPVGG